MEEHLHFLGWKVKDKVTRFVGVVTHVGLDMFGCVQAIVQPEVTIDKGAQTVTDGRWYDVSRLEKMGRVPVMEPVPMKTVEPARVAGCCDKPTK